MSQPPKPSAFATMPTGVTAPMHAPHAKGYLGEQTAGFLLGQKGYVILDGPGGSAGHGITTPGLDGAAYNSMTDDLLIYDCLDREQFAESARGFSPRAAHRSGLDTLAS